MTTDTIFRIASQTKAITSVAILSLVEEGKIALNDPVSRFIPAFAKTTVAVRSDGRRGDDRAGEAADHDPRSADAHRRHLLRHRSRRSPRCTRRRASGRRPASAGTPPTRTSRSATRWSGSRRCRSSPSRAKRWVYGYNTDILGCVVEKASRHAARRVHHDAHHRSARHEGHAVLPAGRAARSPGRGLRERRRRQRSSARPTGRAGRATTSTVRAAASPAVPVCCRRRATTRASWR